jgi:UDP-2-acetamido-3-amino-2,3-dideoxy-glucuronate N-acetyltransferase
VSIFEGVEIEDNVFIGPSATFTNVLTPRSHWPRKNEFLPTHIKQGATIGANATIVCGVTIGRYALIGAGSVVTHDVSDYALVFGVPATQQGWVCFCGAKVEGLNEEEVYYCRTCGSSYKLSKGQLKEIRISY